MPKIEIYTTATCPYCVAAKALLRSKGVEFEEIQISLDDDQARQALMVRADGRRTVPQIFVEGKSIGGSDDLMALNRSGQLDRILEKG